MTLIYLTRQRGSTADLQRAEIDLDYADTLSLSLATSVLINFPRPRFAVLPVSLGVELASIGGTVRQLPSAPCIYWRNRVVELTCSFPCRYTNQSMGSNNYMFACYLIST